MDKIIKPSDSSGLTLNKGKLRSTQTSFQQRVSQAKREEIDPSTMPNRLCLMLDKSSSMSAEESTKQGSKKRIDLLKEALQNFVSRCNLADTAIAIETFPEGFSLPLTSNAMMLGTSVFAFDASGNTPMRRCVESSLSKIPMTRAIIVSDGEATDWPSPYGYNDLTDEKISTNDALLAQYKEQGIPIDCVHISQDSAGEELLRRIARETGGIFIKFTTSV